MTGDDAGGSYVRYDGGSDPVLAHCSTGRRTQNEPMVAVDPQRPTVIVAGANDHCVEGTDEGPTAVWPGYYRSRDGGRSWRASLVPG